jgi:hypothetical protein
MFQSLRIGTPLYVLRKNEPKLEIGEVTFVSQPVNQFNQPVYGGTQPATVDIKLQIADKPMDLQKLPASFTIADCGNGIVVSESREAISNEINILRQNSQRILESTEQHKAIVVRCDELLAELNPQVKQEAERAKEIESLSKRVGGLENSLADIKGLLIQSLNGKTKEK